MKLQRSCDHCQRWVAHCFQERGCRIGLHREACLTCSRAVFYVLGIDPSLMRRHGNFKNVHSGLEEEQQIQGF